MVPHSSTLAWKTPWMEEPGGLESMGSQRVGHFTGHVVKQGQNPNQDVTRATLFPQCCLEGAFQKRGLFRSVTFQDTAQ